MQHIITFCTITKADFYVSDFIFLILLRCNWILLGKPEGTRLRGRPRRRWEYNIKKGLQEVVQEAGTCKRGNEHSGSIKCGEFLDYMRNCLLLRKGSASWK